MKTLPLDVARCEGHGAGPSGHQNRMDCHNCMRRLAPRPAGALLTYMEPPKEFPCPLRIAAGLDHHPV
jgi:hypothetical protein